MSARIKICGLFRMEDIAYANEVKPDYVGFVFAKSRRQVNREMAAKMRKALAPGILAAGVFVDAPCEEIVECLEEGLIDLVQLHGKETEADIRYLRAVTGKPVIKAVRPACAKEVQAWLDSEADYLLFDSGAGSGTTFDWSLLEGVNRDYFLAGGLHEGNLPGAIRNLAPFAVDLSSGVETNGVKDLEKMRTAVRLARAEI